MGTESDGNYEERTLSQEQLLAEREAIKQQLKLLGVDDSEMGNSDDEDDGEDNMEENNIDKKDEKIIKAIKEEEELNTLMPEPVEELENLEVIRATRISSGEESPVENEGAPDDEGDSSEEFFPYLNLPPGNYDHSPPDMPVKNRRVSSEAEAERSSEADKQTKSRIYFEGTAEIDDGIGAVEDLESENCGLQPISSESEQSRSPWAAAEPPRSTDKEEENNDDSPECSTVYKTVMDRIDVDKSNPLPEGWSLITHTSGMPVYYHKFTRVVTHSRPYQVDGLVRDHLIPISSIPCLYREIMDEKHSRIEQAVSKCPLTYEERQAMLEIPNKDLKIAPEEYQKYCERRFKFRQIQVRRYNSQEEKEGAKQQKRVNVILKKRGFELDYDQLKKNNNPGDVLLSSTTGAVLIDLTPLPTNINNKRGGFRKPYLLNPMGKTTVAVLNEFVQRLAKGTLVYEIEDTRNVSCPYQATAVLTMKMSCLRDMAGQCKESLVVLSEIASAAPGNTSTRASSSTNLPVPADSKRFAIGHGAGANKKSARLVAARDALSKLVPKLRVSDDNICNGVLENSLQRGYEEESRELFKKVKIDSPNLLQMCTRFAITKPYSLLRDAVSRSLRWNGLELKMKKDMVGNGSQLSKVTLTLGELEETAEAVGVKHATQMASQLLFKKMHPELLTYGSFLEVYGRLNDKSKLDMAKKHHDEVVRLQDTGNLLAPNTTVLAKLTEEMKNVALIHPPRKFLFGLASQSAGTKHDQKDESTQTPMQDPRSFKSNFQPMMSPQFYPIMPMAMPQLMHPMPSFATLAPPPPPPVDLNAPKYYPAQSNPRKRAYQEDSIPTTLKK